MRTWGLVPFGIGASKSDGLSPACYRPLAEIVSLVLPTGERLTAAVTWGGDMRADEIRPSIGDSLRGARRV